MPYGLTAGQQLLRAFVEIVVDGGIFNVSGTTGDILIPDMISPKGKMQQITARDLQCYSIHSICGLLLIS